MDLKNIILSTLSEIENDESLKSSIEEAKELDGVSDKGYEGELLKEPFKESSLNDEEKFLKSLKERILVLFEGFQAPNNQNLEAKVDLTLNFLEYLLAAIEERLQKIEDRQKI